MTLLVDIAAMLERPEGLVTYSEAITDRRTLLRAYRELRAEVERLREALGYYSQPHNQGWDRGARALAVLAKLQEQA